jgi:hypothetical protein
LEVVSQEKYLKNPSQGGLLWTKFLVINVILPTFTAMVKKNTLVYKNIFVNIAKLNLSLTDLTNTNPIITTLAIALYAVLNCISVNEIKILYNSVVKKDLIAVPRRRNKCL